MRGTHLHPITRKGSQMCKASTTSMLKKSKLTCIEQQLQPKLIPKLLVEILITQLSTCLETRKAYWTQWDLKICKTLWRCSQKLSKTSQTNKLMLSAFQTSQKKPSTWQLLSITRSFRPQKLLRTTQELRMTQLKIIMVLKISRGVLTESKSSSSSKISWEVYKFQVQCQ
jgi:hypothetical protein